MNKPVSADARPSDSASQTYFGLRFGLAVLAAMLYIGVLAQWLIFDCSQGSISAYYFTPVRPVLIAALASIGAGLIIYHGNSLRENSILDVAGFLAIVVAFVPSQTPRRVAGCITSDQFNAPDYRLRIDDEVFDGIAVSMVALFGAALLGLAAGLLSKSMRPKILNVSSASRLRTSGLAVSGLLALAILAYCTLPREWFRIGAHPVAAITFFLLVLYIIHLNASDSRVSEKNARDYKCVFYATIASIVGAAALFWLINWVFWVETAGVLGFMAFWLLQTRELGSQSDRPETVSKRTVDDREPK